MTAMVYTPHSVSLPLGEGTVLRTPRPVLALLPWAEGTVLRRVRPVHSSLLPEGEGQDEGRA